MEIAHVLFTRREHLSADQILKWVNSRYAENIEGDRLQHAQTVLERKLIRELVVDPAKIVYDPNTEPHHHLLRCRDRTAHGRPRRQHPRRRPAGFAAGTVADGVSLYRSFHEHYVFRGSHKGVRQHLRHRQRKLLPAAARPRHYDVCRKVWRSHRHSGDSVSGTGNASVGGTLTFDPKIHNQRSSLALANGQISIAWASHEDTNPYHGWVMSYNASNLQQTGIWSSSPDGFMAGIWMSGRGPAVDASGNVYYMVGNGDWNGTRNFGESMVKLGSTPGMPLLDWFTPDTWSSLNAGDVDYGSSARC